MSALFWAESQLVIQDSCREKFQDDGASSFSFHTWNVYRLVCFFFVHMPQSLGQIWFVCAANSGPLCECRRYRTKFIHSTEQLVVHYNALRAICVYLCLTFSFYWERYYLLVNFGEHLTSFYPKRKLFIHSLNAIEFQQWSYALEFKNCLMRSYNITETE